MARIQILTLPADKAGDVETYPFALIIDQADDLGDDEVATALDAFATQCGARCVLVTPATMDVA